VKKRQFRERESQGRGGGYLLVVGFLTGRCTRRGFTEKEKGNKQGNAIITCVRVYAYATCSNKRTRQVQQGVAHRCVVHGPARHGFDQLKRGRVQRQQRDEARRRPQAFHWRCCCCYRGGCCAWTWWCRRAVAFASCFQGDFAVRRRRATAAAAVNRAAASVHVVVVGWRGGS